MTTAQLVAGYFAWLMVAMVFGFTWSALCQIPVKAWIRPCKWCFWIAIALIVGALGFPGWYFLFILNGV